MKDGPIRPTGLEECYIIKNNQKLRFGYTTGSCAAAAAAGAAIMALTGENPEYVELTTPKGITLCLPLEEMESGRRDWLSCREAGIWASCGVRKDAGDDPDVTDGLLVKARAELTTSPGIRIAGGKGVGRVTRPGLEQPVGEAAINRVPRQMIEEAVRIAAEEAGYEGGFLIEISVPGGEDAARRTFNPRLGIEGGISILGTSGIVEPMSETALIKSIEIEMRQQISLGRRNLVVTLGNYGKAYLDRLDALPMKESIKCSNYIGEVIDMAVAMEAESLLFVAHMGKFIKVAGGIMNTHSRSADSRAEIMAAAALRAGCSRETALKILDTLTTDEGLEILDETGLLQETVKEIMKKISGYLDHRAYGKIRTEALVFSNERGYLGETAGCRELMENIKGEMKKHDRK